ncbi:MAG: tetratricopeptide repeat protein [Saprospiraceae bacterium]|jgi:tetratricopeptide (TPR) repeat protein|nr:tetratricopeptide repeat protein [Saprospiraceae bacterium]MBL0025374.1 tetratricopeptide repeat protein [Saprospiraceae bacterium]
MISKVFLPVILVVIISCNNKKQGDIEFAELEKMESQYVRYPSDSLFNALIQLYGDNINNTIAKSEKESLILKAIALCKAPGKENIKRIFTTELIKVSPENSSCKTYLWEIGQSLESSNKVEAASVIFIGYKQKYPQDGKASETERYIITEQKNIHEYIKNMAEEVFKDPGSSGINLASAQKYIDVCESYALVFPNDELAPEYLFRAAEICRAQKNLPEMMKLFEWINNYFPTYKKSSLVMFLKGFAMDSDFGRPDQAKKAYETFLKKFPQDSLAKDVSFLLKNLGKSDEEVLNELEKNQKKPQTK